MCFPILHKKNFAPKFFAPNVYGPDKSSEIPPHKPQIDNKVVHCYDCGSNSHNHGSFKCPPKVKHCSYCKNPNNFASVCFNNKEKKSRIDL